MKKIIASILAITMLLTTMSACIIPASAETVAVATGNEIFSDDFQDYGTGNWLANLDSDGFVTDAISGMEEKAWTIYGYNYTTENAPAGLLEVVTDPKNPEGDNKVLKFNTGTMANTAWFRVRRNANANDGLKRATDLNGKKMVIKAKFYVPKGISLAANNGAFGYDPRQTTPLTASYNYFGGVGRTYSNTTWGLASVGGNSWGYNTYAYNNPTVKTNDWFEIKYVVDLTEYNTAAHPSDTMRSFYDGVIHTANLGTVFTDATKVKTVHPNFPQPSTVVGVAGEKVVDNWGGYNDILTESSRISFGDFFGTSITLGSNGTQNQSIYMDDLEVYYVTPFAKAGDAKFEKVDADGNWYGGKIEIPFNNNLSKTIKESNTRRDASIVTKTYDYTGANYKNLFTLKDKDGNVIDGIANAYVKEGQENVLVLEMNKSLTSGMEYTVVADAVFMDEEGQGLNYYSDPTDILTFTAGVDPYANYLYKEGFDAYEIDGTNWITSIDTNRFVTATGVTSGAFTANKPSTNVGNKTHSAKIAVDPLDETGENKVMVLDGWDPELASQYDGKSGYATHIRINANTNQGISRSSMGKGQKLVYKAKVYLPAGYANDEVGILVNPGAESYARQNHTSGIGATTNGQTIYPIATGTSTYIARKAYDIRGNWVEIKHVVDVSKALSATHSDTARAYLGDELIIDVANGNITQSENGKYSVTKGDLIIDHLPAGALFQNGAVYQSIGSTFWGNHFTITTGSKIASAGQATTEAINSKYYIDDLEAYWIDALAFTASNAENYEGGKVKLAFNQKIRETVNTKEDGKAKSYTLKQLFSVVDNSGNAVADGIADVYTENNGKTVVIIPGSLESNKDYKIVIDPKLIDEHGQGLENNSSATYVDLHVGEFKPFTLENISQTSVSGFATGRDVKITATFSHEIADEVITDGIVVTNTDTSVTVARNEGWTAEYATDKNGSANKKVVVFTFDNLPNGNYKVTADEDFVAENGANLSSVFEITITGKYQPQILFNETFDDALYTTGETNWLDRAKYTGSELSNAYTRRVVGNWDVQVSSYVEGDFIGVVDKPEGLGGNFEGKVLKMSSSRGSSSKDFIAFRRNFFDNRVPLRLDQGEYAGKVLVYEADIYAENIQGNTTFFSPSVKKASIYDYSEGMWHNRFTADGQYSPSGGQYRTSFASYGPLSAWAQATSPKADSIETAPRKLKIVVDETSELDTMRVYLNGKMVTRLKGDVTRLKDHEMNRDDRYDFGPGYDYYNGDKYGTKWDINEQGDGVGLYGIWGTVFGTASAPATIYLDNFKAYLAEPFTVESVTGSSEVFNVVKSSVDFTFSKPVKASTISGNVVLLDENGNEVANGIKSATLSDAGYKLEVKLSDTLPPAKKYTVKLKKELTDEDGFSISTQYHYFDYPIDENYLKKEGSDNVYLITDLTNVNIYYECTYVPKTATTPAYVTYNLNGVSYKTALDAYMADYYKMKTEVDVVTAKASSLFAEATDVVIEGTNVSTSVKFTNPEVEEMDVWCVIAVYGERNKLIGYMDITQKVAPNTTTDAIDISLTAQNSNIKSVKMFVWNNKSDIKSYQKAEALYNK